MVKMKKLFLLYIIQFILFAITLIFVFNLDFNQIYRQRLCQVMGVFLTLNPFSDGILSKSIWDALCLSIYFTILVNFNGLN